LLKSLSFDIGAVVPLIILFVPAYVMFAALMAALGATFADTQDAQGIMGLFIILTMIPVWLMPLIGENPHGLLAVGLGMFPFTALSASTIRVTFSTVPAWQTVLSTVILVVSAGFAVWLAGRAFRLGMLRYGQDLNWRQVFRRGQSEVGQYEENVTHCA
jgi:ABC-2 type transport system permease protein